MKVLFLFVALSFISCFSASASISELKALIENKHFSKAQIMGEKLLLKQPNSPVTLFFTALAMQQQNQLSKAKVLYLKAINTEPTFIESYNNLAHIYVIEKDYKKATEILTQALKAQSNTATAYDNLSAIYKYLASQAYLKVLDNGSQKTKTKPLKTKLITALSIKNEASTPLVTAKVNIPKASPQTKTATKQTIQNKSAEKEASNKLIQDTILAWAKDWQNKRFEAYTSYYIANYAPKQQTHQQWLNHRKKRIVRPDPIQVKVSNFDIVFKNAKAYVNFDQAFKSNNYQDKVRKRMHLIKSDTGWKISSEVTLSVL